MLESRHCLLKLSWLWNYDKICVNFCNLLEVAVTSPISVFRVISTTMLVLFILLGILMFSIWLAIPLDSKLSSGIIKDFILKLGRESDEAEELLLQETTSPQRWKLTLWVTWLRTKVSYTFEKTNLQYGFFIMQRLLLYRVNHLLHCFALKCHYESIISN